VMKGGVVTMVLTVGVVGVLCISPQDVSKTRLGFRKRLFVHACLVCILGF
jgi:hypothetical protein